MRLEATRSPFAKRYLEVASHLERLSIDEEAAPGIWKKTVPELSCHAYVHHAMLSVGALGQDHRAALEHHSISMGLFRQAVLSGHPEALFAAAATYTLTGFVTYRKGLFGFRDIMVHIKGLTSLARNYPVLLQGRFGPLIGVTVKTAVDEEIDRVVRGLECELGVYAEIYEVAIDLLRRTLCVGRDRRYNQAVVYNVWIPIPVEFLNLVWMGEPLALVVMAHFAVGLAWVGEDETFLQGWGEAVVRDVVALLPEEWLDKMEWPRRQLGVW